MSSASASASASAEFDPNSVASPNSASEPQAAASAFADEDAEIEEMKRRIEEEEQKLAALTQSLDKSSGGPSSASKSAAAAASLVDSADIDSRSVYVGQVDYAATTEELKELFSACGPVNRVTILVDKHTGHPKGFAYVEFSDVDSVSNACLLNDTEFKGRLLKVTPKRTNVPAFQRGRGGVRGGFRGGSSRGAPRGGRGGSQFFRGGRGGAQFKNQKTSFTPY